MTVLVTGAGLIGTHTAQLLLDQGAGVCLYDPNPSPAYVESVVGPDRKLCYIERGDVRDLATMIEVMRRRGVTRILHTGGLLSTRVDENPYMAFQTNVLGTLNAIEAARLHGLARVVFVSSAMVYQGGPSLAPSEAPISEDTPYWLPSSLYGAYKAMAELLTQAYQRLTGVNALIVRPCAVYGRGEFVGGAQIGQTLQNLLVRALDGPPGSEITVDVPTGERLYVKDAAMAIREAIFVEKPQTRVYNVGSGEIVGAEQLASAISTAIPGAHAVAVETAAAEVRPLDLTYARQDLNYSPQWPLARAIPDYVEELRAHDLDRRR